MNLNSDGSLAVQHDGTLPEGIEWKKHNGEKGQKRNARPKPSGAAQLKRISKKRKNSK